MSRSSRTTVGFSVVIPDRERIVAAAGRYGLSVSAYCLHAVMDRVRADEAVTSMSPIIAESPPEGSSGE